MNETKRTEIYGYRDELVKYRRDFHMHPELGFEEFRTSKRIEEILKEWNVDVEKEFCRTAVIATIKGEKPGKVIGIRADMDALAMEDQKTDAEYRSVNQGICHACGHDVHVVWALGVLKYFSNHKNELAGTLKVVFQPAEEGPAPGGGKLVVDSGKVDDVDIMIGAHTDPDFPFGTAVLRRNEMLASTDNFNIVIKGVGGHGAYPHLCKDAMMVAIEAYSAFHNILARELDPMKNAVLTICYFNCGSSKAPNVIQPTVNFGGSVRGFDNDVRNYIFERMETILKNICEMNGCTYEMEVSPISIALLNDDDLVDVFDNVCSNILGKENVIYLKSAEMGYDDFAYYSTVAKAGYFYIGTTKKEDVGKITFHHPLFDVDEDCLCTGVEIFVDAIKEIAQKL